MPIINQTTHIDPIQSRINMITGLNTNLFNSNKNGLLQIFDLIWDTQQIITLDIDGQPTQLIENVQAIFDHFGTDAVKLFQAANLIIQLIQLEDPTFIGPIPPLNYALNQDGTVTVSPKP
jgi:hypothetical protein